MAPMAPAFNVQRLPHLNGHQFYHVSPAQLEVGDTIKPGAKVGKANFDYETNFGGMGRNKWAFMSPTDDIDPDTHETGFEGDEADRAEAERRAWEWAPQGHTNRLYIAEAQNVGVPSEANYNSERYSDEYVAKSARVVGRIDIPPAYDGRPNQGQLPGTDWGGAYGVGPGAQFQDRERAQKASEGEAFSNRRMTIINRRRVEDSMKALPGVNWGPQVRKPIWEYE